MITSKELPSFMRIKKLKKLYADGKMRLIYYNSAVAGFYTIDGHKFQNLYIKPEYRRLGLARKSLQTEMAKQTITVAMIRRNCPIKKLIQTLKFQNTGIIVQGKQSLLEIWTSDGKNNNNLFTY